MVDPDRTVDKDRRRHRADKPAGSSRRSASRSPSHSTRPNRSRALAWRLRPASSRNPASTVSRLVGRPLAAIASAISLSSISMFVRTVCAYVYRTGLIIHMPCDAQQLQPRNGTATVATGQLPEWVGVTVAGTDLQVDCAPISDVCCYIRCPLSGNQTFIIRASLRRTLSRPANHPVGGARQSGTALPYRHETRTTPGGCHAPWPIGSSDGGSVLGQ